MGRVTVEPPRDPVERAPVSGAPGASDGERHISWRHCLIGWIAGEAVLLVTANLALAVANRYFGGTGDSVDGGIVGVSTFVAVIIGGFIVASIVYQFVQEATVVHQSLSSGANSPPNLGPMRIDNVISGDLLALFGGSFGGWLARR